MKLEEAFSLQLDYIVYYSAWGCWEKGAYVGGADGPASSPPPAPPLSSQLSLLRDFSVFARAGARTVCTPYTLQLLSKFWQLPPPPKKEHENRIEIAGLFRVVKLPYQEMENNSA